MSAKLENKQIELYAMDLLWLVAKKYYNGLSQPSELYYKRKKVDKRSAKQIFADTIKGLGGE